MYEKIVAEFSRAGSRAEFRLTFKYLKFSFHVGSQPFQELVASHFRSAMSRVGYKRQRTGLNSYTVSQKRPIDKGLVCINQSLSSTQQSTDLVQATFPCTATGIRWDGDFASDATSAVFGYWAIVIVRDGNAASTLSDTDGASLYEPEQDVLAYGHFHCADFDSGAGSIQSHISGNTKSMRKLMGGDKLVFIQKSSAAVGNFHGCVQVFCKS